MRKDKYPKMIDMFASDGKDLVCVIDGNEIRAKRVSVPVTDKRDWIEVDELSVDVL